MKIISCSRFSSRRKSHQGMRSTYRKRRLCTARPPSDKKPPARASGQYWSSLGARSGNVRGRLLGNSANARVVPPTPVSCPSVVTRVGQTSYRQTHKSRRRNIFRRSSFGSAGEHSPFIASSWMPTITCDDGGIHQPKGAGLPIPQELDDEYLTFECPRCERPIVRKGTWFKTISSFKCPSCNAALRLGYPEKLHLFEKHKRLSGGPHEPANPPA